MGGSFIQAKRKQLMMREGYRLNDVNMSAVARIFFAFRGTFNHFRLISKSDNLAANSILFFRIEVYGKVIKFNGIRDMCL